MNKFDLFWNTMDLCDWHYEGNDTKVLMPVIEYLSKQNDTIIFLFDNLMTELLYNLDTKKLAEECDKANAYRSSDDTFLYSRCVALINGPEYYEEARKGRCHDMWNMEFESLLYVPGKAWALKHKKSDDEYPYSPALSFETGSNKDAWE